MQQRFVVLMFAAASFVVCGVLLSAFRYDAAPPAVAAVLLLEEEGEADRHIDSDVGVQSQPHVDVDADMSPAMLSNRNATDTTTSTMTLAEMVRACASNGPLQDAPWMGKGQGVGQHSVGTEFTSYAVHPSLTCVTSGSPVQHFYAHALRTAAGAQHKASSFLSAAHMSGIDAIARPLQTEGDLKAALLRPFDDDAVLRHEGRGRVGDDGARTRTVRQPRPLRFHNRLAVLLTATWNSVNWYHLLMDQLIGLAYTDLTYNATYNAETGGSGGLVGGPLGRLPRTVVHIINSSWNTRWGKADQQACFDFSSAFSNDRVPSIAVRTTAPRQGPLAASAAGAHDDPVHCFCQAVVVGGHDLPRGAPQRNFYSAPRQAAIAEYKRRMVNHFGERPYGEVTQVADFTKYGYWLGGGNASVLAAPRLLFVKRHRRRIGHSEGIEEMARALGFNVAAVYFEELSPAVQFHLSRYADVLMGIHGMALTYVANMDGGGGGRQHAASSSSPCRTLIELMHWVNPSKFWYYQEMAPINGIHLHRVLPVDVLFGPTVLHKAKEKKLLMKNIFWWGQKGFDDQTAFFDMRAIRSALIEASMRLRLCSLHT